MSGIRLLIADNEMASRTMIKDHAEAEGYLCDMVTDGIAALKLFRRNEYHLIFLESALPELDGLNVCRQVRKVSDIPILFLSAHPQEEEILMGFQAGADDYLAKPFSPLELVARTKVFLRRSGGLLDSKPRKLTFGGLCIDTLSHAVAVDDRNVSLTPKEFDLLLFLSQNPNKAYSRNALLNEVWGYDFFGSDRTVDTHVKTLRENIKPYQHYIATVWGFGYKFEV